MNKILLSIVIILVSQPALCAITKYSPKDLNTFKETHKCENCNLANVQFDYLGGSTDYSNSDLRGSILDGSSFTGTIFDHSDFTGATMINAVTYVGGGKNINAAWSNFSKVNFNGADLRNAVLNYSNFCGASFVGANLARADFAYATITADQLNQASCLCGTILPDGTTHDCTHMCG